MFKVDVINISNNELPKYETPASAGCDVRADFSRITPENKLKVFGNASYDDVTKTLTLKPGCRALIPTGLFTAIPEGYEVQVRPRSGLALKHGLTIVNSPGTIDADYRNEYGVIVLNCGFEDIKIPNGERIAQLVLNKVEQIYWNEVKSLDKTERDGGFGSTGTN